MFDIVCFVNVVETFAHTYENVSDFSEYHIENIMISELFNFLRGPTCPDYSILQERSTFEKSTESLQKRQQVYKNPR